MEEAERRQVIKLVNGRAFTQRRAASVESKSVSSLICVPPCQRGLGYGSKPAFCLLDRNKTCYVLTQPGVCLCRCVALRSGAFWVKLGFLQLCFALDSSHAKAVLATATPTVIPRGKARTRNVARHSSPCPSGTPAVASLSHVTPDSRKCNTPVCA